MYISQKSNDNKAAIIISIESYHKWLEKFNIHYNCQQNKK